LRFLKELDPHLSFTTTPADRYFEDYIPGDVHEFGSIAVDEQEVLDFGKRFVPLSYHIDKEAAKKSIYGGVIASGWHTAALMMRIYTENYLSSVANLGSPGGDELRWESQFFPVTFSPCARPFWNPAAPNLVRIAASSAHSSKC
jgi:acyl dehydratase